MVFNLRQKSNWLFIQLSIIGIIITVLLGVLLFTTYNFTLSSLGNFTADKVQAACGCQINTSANYSIFSGFILLITVAIVITFLFAIIKIIYTLIKTSRFIKLQKTDIIPASAKLQQTANNIGIGKQVVEIQNTKPLIFCSGLSRPKIYISSAVIQTLSYAELRAVLLHETHHLLSQEPARLLFIKFMGAFNFIPGIKHLSKKYLSFSEVAADELATDNFTDKNHLAMAMAKILEMQEASLLQKELAVSYFSQITEERILALSDRAYQPSFKKELIKTGAGIMATAFIFFLLGAGMKTQQARAHELYASSGCADKIYFETCNNAWGACANKIFHEEKIICRRSTPYIKSPAVDK